MDQIAKTTEHEVGDDGAVVVAEDAIVLETEYLAERPLYRRFARAAASASRQPRISVVIPTMNEARNLPHVLREVPLDYEIIVVDGGSTDGTPEIARSLRPDAIVMRQPNRGKGDALFAGFEAAHGDILVTLDADGSQRGREIRDFVRALLEGADFAKGSRMLKGGGSADLTRLRRMGNWGLGTAANMMHGTRLTDITYGFNAFWRHTLPYIVNDSNGFEGETIMCVRAARAGLKITEVPCYEDRRIHGESNLRTFRDGWRILSLIVNERFAVRAPVEEIPVPVRASQFAAGPELAVSTAEVSA